MENPYSHPDALASTEWVAAHLEDPSVVIAEVNTDLEAGYRQGHVPGAVGWNLHADVEDKTRRDVPSIRQFEELLGRSGVSNDTTVVLYGDGNNRSATWAFWVMKYYRHEDVRLMNGGRKRWLDEGRPLSIEVPSPVAKTYKAGVPDRSLRAQRDYIVSSLRNRSVRLLDTRTLEEYTGVPDSAAATPQPEIYSKGRIPGAIHVPWDEAANEDGTFRPIDDLRRMYEEKGITPDAEVIPYCRLGVRASYTWFVLKYLLGYDQVRNYDGSWTEWGNMVGMPIESDARPDTG